MSGVDDEMISAWLDGSLDADGMATMDKAMASNPELVLRAERLRHLDNLVRAAVPAEEALPEGMLERLGLAPTAEVVDLATERARRAAPLAARRSWFASHPARAAAGIALVVGLGALFWQGIDRGQERAAATQQYETLSNAARPGVAEANGVMMFARGIGDARAHAVVEQVGARLLGKPNAAGAWQVSLPRERRDAVLAGLRARPEVTMAEPLDGSGQ